MKLQYLGDARDTFKWDLLHWLCTNSSPPFTKLVFVPMLTPDDPDSTEGQTPSHWFACRSFISEFVRSLKSEPRSLARIAALGSADQKPSPFDVSIFAQSKHIGLGYQRSTYWEDFKPELLHDAVVFFDPDNGLETKTQDGTKWIRHFELQCFLSRLPTSSVAVVYQHRPRRTWNDLFADLKQRLGYAHTAIAAHEGNLAFLTLTNNADAATRVLGAVESYASEHPVVSHSVLIHRDA